jgi:hypothetical protein
VSQYLDEQPDGRHGAATCRQWADTEATARGDLLTESLAADLKLLAFWCAFGVALRDGLEELPDGRSHRLH